PPLAAASVYTLVSTSGIAIYISLGRGHRFRDVFTRESFAVEFAIASLGAAAALLWRLNPLFAPLVLAPIVLARQIKRVPLLEDKAALLGLEQQAKQRLLELDRMKREFVALIAHELGTPIVSIAGYTDLILEGI